MSQKPINIPSLLQDYGLQAKKSLGQNFLTDPTSLQSVAEAAGITAQDVVLEIGAGPGNLTRELAASASRVVAVELDQHFLPVLEKTLVDFTNVQIVHADILKVNPSEMNLPDGYIVAANIPYYITSAVIRHLLEADVKPKRIVLTVQEQVAERICAVPNDMNLLALSVQVYGQPMIAYEIPASAFYPAPEVDSAVVRIELFPTPVIPTDKLELFFHLAKAGFSQKRKTLRNSLSAGMRLRPVEASNILENCGIDPMRRAETLSLEEWDKLVEHWK
jgi:16S rRNA (adenine1518-N6/adenine1519-N6)-dimethyltransferase